MDLSKSAKLRDIAMKLKSSAELDDPEPVSIDVLALEEAAEDLDALHELLSISLSAIARLLSAGDAMANHISDFAGCYCNEDITCGWCTQVDEWKNMRGY